MHSAAVCSCLSRRSNCPSLVPVLFRDVEGGAKLIRDSLSSYLQDFGTKLVNDPDKQKNPIEYVEALFELRRKYKNITEKAFTTKKSAAAAAADPAAASTKSGSEKVDKEDKAFDTGESDAAPPAPRALSPCQPVSASISPRATDAVLLCHSGKLGVRQIREQKPPVARAFVAVLGPPAQEWAEGPFG